MEHKYDILDSLVKSQKPEVPTGFFENFGESLDFNSSDEAVTVSAAKKNKPEVPEDFFENFSAQLMDKIAAEESNQEGAVARSKSGVFSIRNISIFGSIAACLLIGFFIFKQDESATITNDVVAEVEPNETVLTESDEAYLAFLDEDELIDFLIENEDINLDENSEDEEDITEDLYFIVDGEIEDFYLEDL